MRFDFIFQPIAKWLAYQPPAVHTPSNNFNAILQTLKPCDVILVQGRTRASNVIRSVTQSPWTHSVLYIGRLIDIHDQRIRNVIRQYFTGDETEHLVIDNSLELGTTIGILEKYQYEHIRICRPCDLSDNDGIDVMRYALSHIGHHYNVRQVFDLARLLLPWRFIPRRWRSSLFRQHSTHISKTICSTLIAEAFNFVNFPVLPLIEYDHQQSMRITHYNPRLIVPCQFDYSPYFEVIKCPEVSYRDLHPTHAQPLSATDTRIIDARNAFNKKSAPKSRNTINKEEKI